MEHDDGIAGLHRILRAAFIILAMAAIAGPPLYMLLRPAAP